MSGTPSCRKSRRRERVVAGLVHVAQHLAPGPADALRQHARTAGAPRLRARHRPSCRPGPATARGTAVRRVRRGPSAAAPCALVQPRGKRAVQLDLRAAALLRERWRGASRRPSRCRGGRSASSGCVSCRPGSGGTVLATHAVGGGLELQRQQVAGQHQRVGDHVVGELRRLVEGRQALVDARRAEQAAVQQQVAADVRTPAWRRSSSSAHSCGTPSSGSAPPLSTRSPASVPPASGAALRSSVRPRWLGPRLVQRHDGGQHLHRRAGLHRHVGAVAPGGRGVDERHRHRGQRVGSGRPACASAAFTAGGSGSSGAGAAEGRQEACQGPERHRVAPACSLHHGAAFMALALCTAPAETPESGPCDSRRRHLIPLPRSAWTPAARTRAGPWRGRRPWHHGPGPRAVGPAAGQREGRGGSGAPDAAGGLAQAAGPVQAVVAGLTGFDAARRRCWLALAAAVLGPAGRARARHQRHRTGLSAPPVAAYRGLRRHRLGGRLHRRAGHAAARRRARRGDRRRRRRPLDRARGAAPASGAPKTRPRQHWPARRWRSALFAAHGRHRLGAHPALGLRRHARRTGHCWRWPWPPRPTKTRPRWPCCSRPAPNWRAWARAADARGGHGPRPLVLAGRVFDLHPAVEAGAARRAARACA